MNDREAWRKKDEAQAKAGETEEHIASRLLAALEELSEGMALPAIFRAWKDGRVYAVPPDRLDGIFDAIRERFEEMRDWSLLKQARDEANDLRFENRRLETQVAAMREALEAADELLSVTMVDSNALLDEVLKRKKIIRAALSSDAGKGLTEKEKALKRKALKRVVELADQICSIFEIHDYPEIEAVPVIEELGNALATLKEAKP